MRAAIIILTILYALLVLDLTLFKKHSDKRMDDLKEEIAETRERLGWLGEAHNKLADIVAKLKTMLKYIIEP